MAASTLGHTQQFQVTFAGHSSNVHVKLAAHCQTMLCGGAHSILSPSHSKGRWRPREDNDLAIIREINRAGVDQPQVAWSLGFCLPPTPGPCFSHTHSCPCHRSWPDPTASRASLSLHSPRPGGAGVGTPEHPKPEPRGFLCPEWGHSTGLCRALIVPQTLLSCLSASLFLAQGAPRPHHGAGSSASAQFQLGV